MSWSCPFHSFQLPLHVPVIFLVCPLHFPCVSRSFVASQFPTSPVVPIGCLVLCFPFIPPALPLFSFLSLSCPFQFPFVSLSFPVAFLSFRLPIFSLISLHFLAFPLCSPAFFQRFRKEDVQKHRVFPDFRQKETEPAGGFEPGTPAPRRLRLAERHQTPPLPLYPTDQTAAGGGDRERVSSILSYVSDTPSNVGGYKVLRLACETASESDSIAAVLRLPRKKTAGPRRPTFAR